jgi:hypothetical protein
MQPEVCLKKTLLCEHPRREARVLRCEGMNGANDKGIGVGVFGVFFSRTYC